MAIIRKDYPYPHWEIFDARTDNLIRIVPERGGLITEWKFQGKEVLYFDLERFLQKEKSVRGGIPILFPICGNVKDGLLKFGIREFNMHQHGFARDSSWELTPLDDQSGVILKLKDSQKTLNSYPFQFSCGAV